MVNVLMPARFSFTPAAIPPNPAPITTTLGVPRGPNSSGAVGFTAASRCSPPSRIAHELEKVPRGVAHVHARRLGSATAVSRHRALDDVGSRVGEPCAQRFGRSL